MFKGSYDPFGHFKHKLLPKERPKVKIENLIPDHYNLGIPRFPCVQVVCDILLESSQQGLQLCLNLISIEGLHTKLWAPKVAKVPNLGISGLPLGSPKTK
jgi:hypothetical protein